MHDDAEANRREQWQWLDDRMRNACWRAQAAFKHYGRACEGRYLMQAAAALWEYERLTNPRLHRRLGYTGACPALPAGLADSVKTAVLRMAARLLTVPAFAKSRDLPAIRAALGVRSPVTTARVQAEHHRLNLLSAIQFERMAARPLEVPRRRDAAGTEHALTDRESVFRFVAATLGGGIQTARRAWRTALSRDDAPPAWRVADLAVTELPKARAGAVRDKPPDQVKKRRAAPVKPRAWQR